MKRSPIYFNRGPLTYLNKLEAITNIGIETLFRITYI